MTDDVTDDVPGDVTDDVTPRRRAVYVGEYMTPECQSNDHAACRWRGWYDDDGDGGADLGAGCACTCHRYDGD